MTSAARPTIGVGLIGYAFMGAAHSQAWRSAPRFFDLPLDPAMNVLCGRNAVQLSAPTGTTASLDEIAARLTGVGNVQRNSFLLRLTLDDHVLTVFPDGRTIIGGTNDVATARSLHARYIGA